MRHKKEFTNPALLAGLWVFLSMLEIMTAYSQEELDDLKAIAQQFLGKLCRYMPGSKGLMTSHFLSFKSVG